MNDRYLFRAKRIENGEWVEGYYIYYPHGYYAEGEIEHILIDTSTSVGLYKVYSVDPSTICQCTGFYDEDEKKIFERDIVVFIDCTSTENGYSEHYCMGRVLWDEETGSFQVTERLSAESYEVLDRGCKVIGNMFDNPELMEQEG